MVKVQKTSVPSKRKESSGKAAGKLAAAPGAESNTAAATFAVAGNELQLSAGEVNILAVFKKYLMTPGRMLCLNNTDIGTMKRSLDKLIAAGLLIPEDFKGSYSLTRSGFNVMNELN